MEDLITEVTTSNCNYWLTYYYKKRDRISKRISTLCSRGYSTEALEKHYDRICEIISELCDFRRNHDCLLEGDPGYGIK
jgi:hypothetical protein